MGSVDHDPGEFFGGFEADEDALIGAVKVGRTVKTGAGDGGGFDFTKMRAFVPVKLTKLAIIPINTDAILENVMGGRVDDFGITVCGEESLPVFGMTGSVGIAALWPVTSQLFDFPSAVAGAVTDDEAKVVGNERVGFGGVIFGPVSESACGVGPGVSIPE